MMRKSGIFLLVGVLASGVAIACAMKPMPPFVIKVSLLNVAWKAFQGYDNPSRAAALDNLDDAAKDLLGAAEWKNNNYIGNVTYKFSSGTALVTEDKPCDKDALETIEQPEESDPETGEGGGSGGFSGYTWYGGSFYGSGGTCIYNCGGIVEVGEVDPQ